MPVANLRHTRMTQQILIISDDEANDALQRALEARACKTTLAADADEGYRQLVKTQFDLVVVNVAKANAGAELIRRIRSNPGLAGLKVLTLAEWGTGQGSLALSYGADAFEPKPINSDRVVTAIEKLLRLTMTAVGSNGSRE